MNQTCPQCFSTLTSSEVGHLCVNCGYLQHRLHNHPPVQDSPTDHPQDRNHQHSTHAMPGNLEAPRGLDELLFQNTPDIPPASDQNDDITSDLPKAPDEKPQIINHHASSQYRRRLEKRLENLATPEIESPLEPESSLETREQKIYHKQNYSSIDQEDSLQMPQSLIENSQEDQLQEATAEATKPHRPSPYLLNMSDAEPETNTQSPDHQSPHGVPSTPANHQYSTQHEPTPSSSEAMARADALLTAAASPQKTTSPSKLNYIVIIITVILLFGIGSLLAFSILKKPTPKETTQPTSNNTPSTTQNSNPTPSNLTESSKRDGERKDTLNTIAIALSAYKKANGSYPAGNDIEVLSPLITSTPPYLREIKLDPLSSSESNVTIKYGYTSDGSKFTLTASLENKQDPDAVNGLYIVKNP